MERKPLPPANVYPTALQFDRAVVVRGMQALGFAASDSVVAHDIVILGQVGIRGPVVGDVLLRVFLVYRHKETDILGFWEADMAAELVRDLELAGAIEE